MSILNYSKSSLGHFRDSYRGCENSVTVSYDTIFYSVSVITW